MMGGDLLDFAGALTTPTIIVATAKFLLTNVVSNKNAKHIIADINF